jgi:hypothetical protein
MANLTDPNDPIYQQNQTWLRPGETQDVWRQRTALISPSSQLSVPEIPKLSFDISTEKGRTEAEKSIIASKEAEIKAKAEAKIAEEARAQEDRTALQKIQEKFGLVGQKRKEQLGALGFDETQTFAKQKADIAEIESLYTDYDKVSNDFDNQVAEIQGRTGGTIDFANAEVAKINRVANKILGQKSAAIKTKLAIMEMNNNNFTQAQKFVDQAINDYVAGITAEYETTKSFYNEHIKEIGELGDEYDTLMKDKLTSMENAIDNARNEYQFEINKQLEQYRNTTSRMQEERLSGGTVITPTNWTDLQIKTAINGIIEANPGATYNEIIQEINSDNTLANKDRAIQLAQDKFGIKREVKPLSDALNLPKSYSSKPYTTGGIPANNTQTSNQPKKSVFGGFVNNAINFFSNLFQ